MRTYRITVRPRGATRTPWRADTLFGHLCWQLRYNGGEAALIDLLNKYRAGEPPLFFSDGFPAGWMPRPLLPSPRPARGSKTDDINNQQQAKRTKGVHWVTSATFERMRRGESVVLDADNIRTNHTVLKNSINRLTGGTTALDDTLDPSGNLYNAEEYAFVDTSGEKPIGLDVTIYLRAADESWARKAHEWLTQLARSGYGARKSAGYGQFRIGALEPCDELDEQPEGANGFISLANWTPAKDDPTDGFYERAVKYGKLGEELAGSINPFKFPLLQLVAGSCFYAPLPLRDWYGRLVDNIAPLPGMPIVHYSYAFPVAAKLEE